MLPVAADLPGSPPRYRIDASPYRRKYGTWEEAMGSEDSKLDDSGQDAQRHLEQKALRNVRGLVDRIEAEEAGKSRFQMVLVVSLLVAFAVIGVAFFASINGKPSGIQEIAVPAPKAPTR